MSSTKIFGVPHLCLQVQNITNKLAIIDSLHYKFRISFVDMKHKELLDCYEFDIGYSTYSDNKLLKAIVDYHMQIFIDLLEEELGVTDD